MIDQHEQENKARRSMQWRTVITASAFKWNKSLINRGRPT